MWLMIVKIESLRSGDLARSFLLCHLILEGAMLWKVAESGRWEVSMVSTSNSSIMVVSNLFVWSNFSKPFTPQRFYLLLLWN